MASSAERLVWSWSAGITPRVAVKPRRVSVFKHWGIGGSGATPLDRSTVAGRSPNEMPIPGSW